MGRSPSKRAVVAVAAAEGNGKRASAACPIARAGRGRRASGRTKS